MRRVKIIIVLMIVTLALYGCSSVKDQTENNVQNQQPEATAVNDTPIDETQIDDTTVVITDSAGRTVSVPKNPERIATLYAVSGHIATMLDRGDNIVAVNNGLKRDVILNELVPGIANAVMAVSSGQINMESLLESSADLVFISLDIYHDSQQINQLEAFNLPYVVVDFQSIDEQNNVVAFMGTILDAEEEAQVYVEFYDKVIGVLNDALEGLDDSERVRVYHSINEANCTVADNTLPSDWMRHAGGINVSLDGDLEKDGDKYYTNLEQIIVWNPSVIYCNEYGVSDYILENPTWQYIDAVKSKRVYQLPIGISRWGHKTSVETPLAMLWVAHDLYPDIVPDLTEVYAFDFYKSLFEFELTDEMYHEIITGKEMRILKDS